MTEPYISASAGKRVITLATPVRQAGRLVGVSGADTDLQTISNLPLDLMLKVGAGTQGALQVLHPFLIQRIDLGDVDIDLGSFRI